VQEQRQSAHGDVREDQAHLSPPRRAEPAQDPRIHLPERVGALLLEVGLHGGEERRHCHAGQDQGPGVPSAGARATQHVGRGHRGQRADECCERHRVHRPTRSAREVGHRQRGPQPCSGGHAEEVRVGQCVAEHPLVGRPSCGQHGSDQTPQHDPGHPDLPQDRRVQRRESRANADQW
jgi:hypothetical protein